MLLDDHRTPEEWAGLVAKARAQVMEIMEGRLGMQKGELDKAIVWEDVNTPVTCTSLALLGFESRADARVQGRKSSI